MKIKVPILIIPFPSFGKGQSLFTISLLMDAFVIRTKKPSQGSSQTKENRSKTHDFRSCESNLRTNRFPVTNLNFSSPSNQPKYIQSSSSEVGALNKIKPDRGQRRISDLGGVVVLEKIQKYVQKLKDPNISSVAKVILFTDCFF